MPKDVYFLTENLPKPNYFKPEKTLIPAHKTEKKYQQSQGGRLNLLPKVSQRREIIHNKSLVIKNSSVIEAARV